MWNVLVWGGSAGPDRHPRVRQGSQHGEGQGAREERKVAAGTREHHLRERVVEGVVEE